MTRIFGIPLFSLALLAAAPLTASARDHHGDDDRVVSTHASCALSEPQAVPELSGGATGSVLALLAGGMFVMTSRRRTLQPVS